MKKLLFAFLFLFVGVWAWSVQGQEKIIAIDNFKSKYVAPRKIEIFLPREYEKGRSRKFPVLYMHDGQNVFNASSAYGGVAWEADETARKMFKNVDVLPFIIVAIWNTEARFHEYFPEKALKLMTPEDREAMEAARIARGAVESPFLGDNYLKFIVNELKPYIDENYRTEDDRDNTAICGSSMGGLISIYALCEYPKVFGKAACLSTHWPILFNNDNMNPSEAVRKYLTEKLPKAGDHKIYFDYGTKTLDQFYEVHQMKVDEIMKFKKYKKDKDWVTKKYEGAEHNEKSWQERLPIVFKFLFIK